MKIKCEICGKLFYKRPSHFKRVKRNFCSRKCRGIGQRGKNNPAWKNSWIKTCQNCSKKYRYKNSKGKKFCSQKCMGEYKSKKNSIIKKCGYCGRKIKIVLANNTRYNFCDKNCFNKFHSLQMSGKNNPNWIGGIGKLPYKWDFNNKLKDKIRKRDKLCCRLCGICEKEIIRKKGCGLAVHHIDYNKKNNNKNNLISLCNKCHGYTHYNRSKWKQELSKKLKK